MKRSEVDARAPVVAVVDSGVSADHEVFASCEFVPGTAISPRGLDVVHGAETDDVNGHGTAIAGVIVWHAPGVRLMSVRVLDHELRSRGDALAAAIEWAVLNGADIVNVSADTREASHRERLEHAVAVAAARDVLIVASAGRFGSDSMPACLAGVCSVGPAVLHDSRQWIHDPGGTPEFLAQAGLQVVAAPTGYDALSGASCAAAHISGIAAAMYRREAGGGQSLLQRLRDERATSDPSDEEYVVQSRAAIAPPCDPERLARHGDVFGIVMDELSRRTAAPLEWSTLLGLEALERGDLYPAIVGIQQRLGVSVSPLDCAGLAIASPYAIGLLMIGRLDAAASGPPIARV